MRRADVIARLQRGRDRLQASGVGELYLYGSVARDQAVAESDVDLLIEPQDRTFSIFSLVSVQDACVEMLGVPAEVHDYDGYRRLPEFRRRVGADLIRVF